MSARTGRAARPDFSGFNNPEVDVPARLFFPLSFVADSCPASPRDAAMTLAGSLPHQRSPFVASAT
jgi:hypothetical protein